MLPAKSTINSRHDIVCVDSFILFFFVSSIWISCCLWYAKEFRLCEIFCRNFSRCKCDRSSAVNGILALFCISNSLTLLVLAIDRSTASVINTINRCIFVLYPSRRSSTQVEALSSNILYSQRTFVMLNIKDMLDFQVNLKLMKLEKKRYRLQNSFNFQHKEKFYQSNHLTEKIYRLIRWHSFYMESILKKRVFDVRWNCRICTMKIALTKFK